MGNAPILGQPQPPPTPCIECVYFRSLITESRPHFLVYAICGHDYGRRMVTCYRTGCSKWEAATLPKVPGRWRERLAQARLSALPDVDESLPPVVLDADPLHVAAVIGAAGAEGDHVVDVEARAGAAVEAGGGTSVVSTEGADLGARARDLRCCVEIQNDEKEQGG